MIQMLNTLLLRPQGLGRTYDSFIHISPPAKFKNPRFQGNWIQIHSIDRDSANDENTVDLTILRGVMASMLHVFSFNLCAASSLKTPEVVRRLS